MHNGGFLTNISAENRTSGYMQRDLRYGLTVTSNDVCDMMEDGFVDTLGFTFQEKTDSPFTTK